MSVIVSIDGVLVAPEAASISVFDRGFLYGDGCFEVLRTWAGRARELAAHLDRLSATAAMLRLRSVSRAVLAGYVEAALAAAPMGAEQRIRIVLTRGEGGLAAPVATLGPGRAIVIVEPLGPQPSTLTAAVIDYPLARRPGGGHKLLAYAEHVIAKELARDAGADEGIRLDSNGDVAEGATSNVFVVGSEGVTTPPLGAGVLPGIVRGRVLALGRTLGVAVRERTVTRADLSGALEIFVTSSLRGIVPVVQLDGQRFAVGPVTRRLAEAYRVAL